MFGTDRGSSRSGAAREPLSLKAAGSRLADGRCPSLSRMRCPPLQGQSNTSHLWRDGVPTRYARCRRMVRGTSSMSGTIASSRQGRNVRRSNSVRQRARHVATSRRSGTCGAGDFRFMPTRPVRETAPSVHARVCQRGDGSSAPERALRRSWKSPCRALAAESRWAVANHRIPLAARATPRRRWPRSSS